MRPSTVLVFDGQSLNNWPPGVTPNPVLVANGRGCALHVVAINATPYFTLATTQAHRTLPLFKNARNSVLIMNGGTGDVANLVDAATTLEVMRVYAQAARDAGCDRVIACTVPAWTMTQANAMTNAMNVIRQALNVLILSKAADVDYWEAVVDLAAVPQFQNPDDFTYFVDGIHFTQTGHNLVAATINPVLDAVMQTLTLPAYKG